MAGGSEHGLKAQPDTNASGRGCGRPYAQQLQAALQRPVYDLTTLAAMMANVVHRQAFPGFI